METWDLESAISEVFFGRESEINQDYCVMCARGGRYRGCECRYFRNGKFTVGLHGADSRICPVCMVTQPSVLDSISKFLSRIQADICRRTVFTAVDHSRVLILGSVIHSLSKKIPAEIRQSKVSTSECHFDTGLSDKRIVEGIQIAHDRLCALREEGYPINIDNSISQLSALLQNHEG